MAKILIVDDDPGMREFLEIMLAREGYTVAAASGGKEAINLCKRQKFDLLITDLRMPGISGIDLLKSVKEISPETMSILITGYASGETAVAAMKEGAFDYLEKDFDVNDLKELVQDALSKKESLKDDIRFIRNVEDVVSFGKMIGKSKGMLDVYSMIRKVSATTASVLILGESGTGKELVARAIHDNSQRKDKPFVAINCGGIPENLLESELFGYMKGSFSGAYNDKQGLFEVAHGGTIFLDEIGELPQLLQVKLLRVLQDKTFIRIGGSRDITVDVRIVAATNENLEERVEKGTFRKDLFYRLNVVTVKIPPLRERQEDIPILVEHFVKKYSREFGKEIRKISSYALELLMEYPFPGNIRELENIIERSVALETTNLILPENLVINQASKGRGLTLNGDIPEEGINLNDELTRIEKLFMKQALQKTNGSKIQAAKLLNVSYDSFNYRFDKLNMNDFLKD